MRTLFSVEKIDGKDVGIVFVWFVREFKPVSSFFIVDVELIPVLSALGGNWHVRDNENPQALPPYMRRRIGGTVKEFRLCHICFTLSSVENPLVLAENWLELCRLSQLNRGRIEAKPINGLTHDCRVENWVLPLGVISEEQSLSQKVSRSFERHHSERPSTLVVDPIGAIVEDEGVMFLTKSPEHQALINRSRQAKGLLPFDSQGNEYDPNPFNVMNGKSSNPDEDDPVLRDLNSLKTIDDGNPPDSERKVS